VRIVTCNRYLGTGLPSSWWRRVGAGEGLVTVIMWVPEACTLPTVEQPLRVVEFDNLFASAVRQSDRVARTGLRIHLPPGDRTVATARELAARETACCSFFAFDVRASATGTVLEVRVPESQVAVLNAMQQWAEAARAGGVQA
jgi:hypothetical protein